MMYIFVDDVRNPEDIYHPQSSKNPYGWPRWAILRDFTQVKEFFEKWNPSEFHLSLDHDLGEGPNGLDCLKWLLENGFYPQTLACHSSNPSGRENIISYHKSFMKVLKEGSK